MGRKKQLEQHRYLRVKMTRKGLAYKDNLILNEESTFNSFDIIVNNTNYQPEYLKKIYAVDFYRILKRLEKKLKEKNNG